MQKQEGNVAEIKQTLGIEDRTFRVPYSQLVYFLKSSLDDCSNVPAFESLPAHSCEGSTHHDVVSSSSCFIYATAAFASTKQPVYVFSSCRMKNYMFMGLVEKWLNDFLWQLRMNTKRDEAEGNAERPISVVDLQGAFFIVVMGYTGGLLALLTESCCAFLTRLFTSTIKPYYSRSRSEITG